MVDLSVFNDPTVASATAEIVKQTYPDLIQPSVAEIGKTVHRSVKLLLAPLNGLLWTGEEVVKSIAPLLEIKVKHILEENLHPPKLEIAVPLLEAYRYSSNNNELKEMYINLLASSMDSTKDKVVHPSFVETIKQMDSLDALLFKELIKNIGNIIVINPKIYKSDRTYYLISAAPDWFLNYSIPDYNLFDISRSLIRLSRLGLVELHRNIKLLNVDYKELMETPILKELLKNYQEHNNEYDVHLECKQSSCEINEYGQQFAIICLGME